MSFEDAPGLTSLGRSLQRDPVFLASRAGFLEHILAADSFLVGSRNISLGLGGAAGLEPAATLDDLEYEGEIECDGAAFVKCVEKCRCRWWNLFCHVYCVIKCFISCSDITISAGSGMSK